MAYEILKTIVDAEQQALKMKKDARDKAEKEKKAALEKDAIMLESMERRTAEEIEKARLDAKREVAIVVDKIKATTKETCDLIERKAQEKKEEAIEAVIRRVVGNYGSS
ncbi:MAG: hypothetical protein R3Y53_01140 [Bacillota bacterium]